MQSFLEIQKRLLPDLLIIMQKRYQILRFIRHMEPIGRRILAQQLGLSERVLRSEVEFLKSQQLINIRTSGMSVTADGMLVLEKLEGMMREVTGMHIMEAQLKEKMKIADVIIIPGDSDTLPWIKDELGRTCVQTMKKRLHDKNIIAVTGGTTIATVAEMLTPSFASNKHLVFVPARGGIGEDVKNQANTICARMAEKSTASHRVLYVPDQVSKEVYESFMKEPAIQEVLSLIKSAHMVLHGIGEALTMAKRRHTDSQNMQKIIEGQAVGEAFGYYFDEQGKVVHKVPTIGLQLEDLENIPHVIAAAGGASKAKAIKSYMKSAPSSTILVTDEGAAAALLKDEITPGRTL